MLLDVALKNATAHRSWPWNYTQIIKDWVAISWRSMPGRGRGIPQCPSYLSLRPERPPTFPSVPLHPHPPHRQQSNPCTEGQLVEFHTVRIEPPRPQNLQCWEGPPSWRGRRRRWGPGGQGRRRAIQVEAGKCEHCCWPANLQENLASIWCSRKVLQRSQRGRSRRSSSFTFMSRWWRPWWGFWLGSTSSPASTTSARTRCRCRWSGGGGWSWLTVKVDFKFCLGLASLHEEGQ